MVLITLYNPKGEAGHQGGVVAAPVGGQVLSEVLPYLELTKDNETEETKRKLQNSWNDIAKREYIAILEGNLKEDKGIIKNYLLEDKTHKVYVSKDKKGEYAETHYEVLNRTNKNTIVRIWIKTGKKNQIRVAFASLNHPIIGDKKYGSRTNPIKRLGLHAYKLKITIENQQYEFESKLPDSFTSYCKKE